MTKRPFHVLLAIALLIGSLSGLAAEPVHAQRSTAPGNLEAGRSHFDRGVDYYRDGNINAALIEFKRAYEAAPNYRVLYNLGQVANALNDYVEAQRYFQRYLQEGASDIDAERRTEVNAMITKLGGRIASITVICNVDGAQVYLDDVAIGMTPLTEPLRVSAGTRRLSATMSGRPRSTRVVDAMGGERLTVELELPEPVSQQTTAPQAVATMEPADSSGPGAALWLGIATGALAVGTGVVGILAAQDGSKFHDALNRDTTASEVDRLHDRAATKAILTDILLGATVITGGVTLVVLLTGGKSDKAPAQASAGTRLQLGLGSLHVAGEF